MVVLVIGTTATFLITANRQTISIHADSDNSDTVNISTTDPGVANPDEELLAGQTMSFNNWTGSIWAKAESGSQNVGLIYGERDSEIVKA